MTAITITLANGRAVPFEVDTDREGPANFIFGIRKSGSTLLNRLCAHVAKLNDRRFVAVADRYFAHNVAAKDWVRDAANLQLLYGGNIYGGFRILPEALRAHPVFREGAKVLMVRDPRDTLVSEYFAFAYSHGIPQRTTDGTAVSDLMEKLRRDALSTEIDEYVLGRAHHLLPAFMGYGPELGAPNMTVVKYEEYIFKKPALVRLIAKRFKLKIKEDQIKQMMTWADVRPDGEKPQELVRRVTPGDHLEKLRPDTIVKLNDILRPALDAFEYA